MENKTLSLEEICKFGVRPEDEQFHPFNPDDPTWNESYFFDWYDSEAKNAGHCRIGWMPTQDRLWIWLYLFDGENWAAIEEPRLPASALDTEGFSLDRAGLTCQYATGEALRSGKLKISGFGRILSGPKAGQIVPVAAELDVEAISAAHTLGQSAVKGHADQEYNTSRYEQAIRAQVRQSIDGQETQFAALGERDHSWGPRFWNMNWHFLVANGQTRRFQSTVVEIEGFDDPIRIGYLSAESTGNLTDVQYDLTYHDATPERAIEGTFKLTSESGEVLSGRIEPVSGTAIDVSHAFSPPQSSIYRRTLVRCLPDDGSEPLIGWMEINRMKA